MAKRIYVWFLVVLLALAAGVAVPERARANPLLGVAAVSVGDQHTCALMQTGGVKCWGLNSSGQLGTGNVSFLYNSNTPVNVTGLPDATTISAGLNHTCALNTARGAKCWGSNLVGELGTGATSPGYCNCIPSPSDVLGLTSGVTSISAGGYYSCAVTASGGVKCWGENGWGNLGDGSTTDRSSPVDVTGLTAGASSVSADYSHTCALTTVGGVKCWGLNLYGELGDGSNINSGAPVDVVGLISGVAAISLGRHHSCALTVPGGVRCWGLNSSGQLGDGTTSNSNVPVDVVGLTSGVAYVSAGGGYTCAIASSGTAKCWGANVYGQLGDGTTDSRSMPAPVVNLSGGAATDISVSMGYEQSTCALSAGYLQCWGSNAFGHLGNGTSGGLTTYPVTAVVDGPKAVGGFTSLTDAGLSSGRSTSHRSAALPFAALAVVGVGSAIGAAYLARRWARR